MNTFLHITKSFKWLTDISSNKTSEKININGNFSIFWGRFRICLFDFYSSILLPRCFPKRLSWISLYFWSLCTLRFCKQETILQLNLKTRSPSDRLECTFGLYWVLQRRRGSVGYLGGNLRGWPCCRRGLCPYWGTAMLGILEPLGTWYVNTVHKKMLNQKEAEFCI